jgi:RNA polymerase sigma factor (sigma-70 family)
MNPPRLSDVKPDLPQLVAEAQQGDAEAWNTLVEQFAGLVWHVIRGFRLSNAAAEDVYQTTWLRLAEHLDRIRQPESLGGWLARTARNECLRTVKLGGREDLRDNLDVDLVDRAAPVGRSMEADATSEVLWRAFATLSQACQQLLRLLIAEPPVPYDRISDMLGMSIGSIGPTRARCLAKLRTSRGVYQLGEGS